MERVCLFSALSCASLHITSISFSPTLYMDIFEIPVRSKIRIIGKDIDHCFLQIYIIDNDLDQY